MKLKRLVLAMMFALSAPAWSADSDNSNTVQYIDDANPTPSASSPASASTKKAAGDAIAWKYVNGQKSAAGSSSGADQSAISENSSGNNRSARAKDSSGNDQPAMSDDPGDSDQSAATEQEDNFQISEEEAADDDMMAMATPGSRSGSFQPATLEDFKAATQDKLVVILPSGWQGSVPQLLAALEKNADAAEVLILSQDDDADANEDDEDEQ